MRIDRLISIIVILLNNKKITAKELSEKFEVSIRTIYRDIDIINIAGIPIVSYSGNNGGFGILENYNLERRVLSLKDMLLILSALKGFNKTLADKELEGAIEKMNILVPDESKREYSKYNESFIFDILPWGYNQKEKEKIKLIQSAIAGKKTIEIDYKNNKGESSKRTIEPMTLVFKGYGWYLFSFCRGKNDFRFFKIHKIKNIKINEECFIMKEKSYTDFDNINGNERKFVNLVLKFSPKIQDTVEEFYDNEKIKILEDGCILVNTEMPLDEWVYSHLLAYGDNLEVLEPLFIREEVIERIKNMAKRYDV